MKILIWIVLLFSASVNGHAQAGFLGKKLNVYVSAGMSPAWFMANHNEEKGFFKFDYWFAPGLDFTFSKGHSAGLEYQVYNTKYPSNYGDDMYPSTKALAYDDISVNCIGVYFKSYREDYAPLGYWHKFQLNYYNYKAKGDNLSDTSYNFSSRMFGFQYGIGKTFVLKNCISISPCVTFGLAFGKGKIYVFPDELYAADGVSLADRKVRNMSLINISLAIGFIPF